MLAILIAFFLMANTYYLALFFMYLLKIGINKFLDMEIKQAPPKEMMAPLIKQDWHQEAIRRYATSSHPESGSEDISSQL